MNYSYFLKTFSSFIIFWCIAVHEKLKEQIKDVDAARSKEIPLFWCGMAEVSGKKCAFIYQKFFFTNKNLKCHPFWYCAWILLQKPQAIRKE